METIAPLFIIGSFLAFIAYEAIRPARKDLPRVAWWRTKGIVFFVLTAVISSVLPFVWADFVAKHALLNLSGLGTVAGAAAGYVVFQLVGYWWHRLQHTSSFIWRWSHQMHHSAERVDTFGAFWFHPTDMVGWTFVSSFALTVVVGLSAEATTAVLLAVTLLSIFQHANIKTPRWLGYFVQRPESHSWHHARDRHRDNYADLPLFDIVFGTFDNPRDFAPSNGFYDGASLRLADMLLFRDVAKPGAERVTSPAA